MYESAKSCLGYKMLLATVKVIFLPEGMDLILEEQRYTKEKEGENDYCGQVET